MDKIELSDDASWFWIGLRFGLGFALGGAIISSITAMLWLAWIESGIRLAFRDPLKAAAAQSQRFPQQYAPAPQRTRTITVPAKSGQDCLKETGGILNEQYQRCNSGYSYEVPE